MKNRIKIGPKSSYPTWGDLLGIVGVLIAASVLGGIVKMLLDKSGSASVEFSTFIAYMIQFSLTIAYALYQKRLRGAEGSLLRFSLKKANPAIILWGVILTFCISMVIEPVINLFPDHYMEYLKSAIGTGGWAMLTTIVIAPILEETLFRGVIQESAMRKWGGFRGILITSIIFGAIHIIPPQAINAFFVSLVLGYIYMKTQSLLPVIAIHAVNNAIAYFTMVVSGDEMLSTREMINSDFWYWIVYGVCAAIFIVAFINVYRYIKKDERMREQQAQAKKVEEVNGEVADLDNNIDQ